MLWYESGDISYLQALSWQDVVSVDVETTGLNPAKDDVVEISAVYGDGTLLFHSLFSPLRKKTRYRAQGINGIVPTDLNGQPSLSDCADFISELLLGARLLVGYNLPFDLAFLRASNISAPHVPHFDVMREFAPVLSREDLRNNGYRWVTLQQCALHYSCAPSTHRATRDAQVTAECFQKMIRDDGTRFGGDGTVPYLAVVERYRRSV